MNLLSEGKIVKRGYHVVTTIEEKKFYLNDELVLKALPCKSLYILNTQVFVKNVPVEQATPATIDEWHKRFGHVNKSTIEKMAAKQVVKGLKIDSNDKSVCEGCAKGKCTKVPHGVRTSAKAKKPGIVLHFDTAGPIKEASLGNSRYLLLCKDEFSSYRICKFIETKSQIPDEVKLCISQTELETQNRVLKIVTDNGTEFKNFSLENFLRDRGINHSTSVVYTPQQNGYIERDIRTVFESGRTMLKDAKLPKSLWAEAMNTAVYVLNRSVNSKKDLTPFELWTGERPDVGNLKVFGQQAVISKMGTDISKLGNKGVKMHFVGYTDRFNTYRFYDPKFEQVITRCDVVFLPVKHVPIVQDSAQNTIDIEMDANEVESQEPKQAESLIDETISDLQEEESVYDEADSLEPIYQNADEIRRSQIPALLKIGRNPPKILSGRTRSETANETANAAIMELDEDPQTFKEAMSRSDKHKWLEAMEDELKSLYKNEVWDLVPRPDANVVSCKWVYRIKRKPNNEIERYKARLVARGFSQIEGVDYNETFAPVVNNNSIRMLFAYAAIEKLEIGQFDVKTAFLYGDLEEEIYMEQPDGFKKGDSVCRLKKSLYGLKQAPRQWGIKFQKALVECGLTRSSNDECVYYRREPLLFIAIYVDDGIIMARKQIEIRKLLYVLKRRFEMSTLDSTVYLGFQILRGEDGEIKLHQSGYIRKVLVKYGMEEAKIVANPCSSPSKDESKPIDPETPYREAVGSLMYAAVTTRIDIAFAVNMVARKLANPTEADWTAVKRIMRYLRGTQDLCLTYNRSNNQGLIAYCDADLAGDIETAKSTSGSVVMFGGGPIAWRSKRQTMVSRSSTEAELISMMTSVEDIQWIREFAIELGMVGKKPIKLYCDNESTVRIVHDERSMQRTKLLKVKAAYIREQIEKKELVVEHIPATKQRADMLTKQTTTKQYNLNRCWLMNLLSILMIVTVSIHTVTPIIFDRVTPIIWTQTNKYVTSGLANHIYEIQFISPCAALQKIPRPLSMNIAPQPGSQSSSQPTPFNPHMKPFQQQNLHAHLNKIELDDYETALSDAYSYCESIYRESILNGIQELTHVKRHDKRSPFAIASTLVGLFLSNGILTRIDKLWNGDADKELADRQHLADEKLKTLTQELNITEITEKAISDTLWSTSEIVKSNSRRLSALAHYFPNLMFTTQYFASHLLSQGSLLAQLRYGPRGRKLNINTLSELLHTDLLEDIEESDVALRNVKSPKPSSLRIEFQARKRDDTTNVYRINPFRIWANLTGMPVLMEYAGERYLIYNQSSNCVRAIEEPTQNFVSETCSISGGKDSRLKIWNRIMESKNPYSQPATTIVKESWPYNYVYCYRLNITVDGETTKCPPYVFKLNYTTGWNSSDTSHHPQPTLFRAMEILIDSHQIHSSHFEGQEHIIDENMAIDKIFTLEKTLEDLKNENMIVHASIGGGVTYATALRILMIVFMSSILLLIIFAWFKHTSDNKHHHQVMRTVTDSIYGDGTYEVVRQTRRKRSDVNNHTSATSPSQMNITMNAAPSLPMHSLRGEGAHQ